MYHFEEIDQYAGSDSQGSNYVLNVVDKNTGLTPS